MNSTFFPTRSVKYEEKSEINLMFKGSFDIAKASNYIKSCYPEEIATLAYICQFYKSTGECERGYAVYNTVLKFKTHV